MEKTLHFRRLAAFALLLLSGFAFWRCNTGEGGSLLTVQLSDSLAQYDSIKVVVKLPNGQTQAEKTLRKTEDYADVKPGQLKAILDLGQNPPAIYNVLITTYAAGKTQDFKIEVTPQEVKPPVIVPTVKPIEVHIKTAGPLILVEHGQGRLIDAEVLPADSAQRVTWASLNTAVVTLDSTGLATPGDSGETDVIVRSRADTSKKASLHVKVIKIQPVEAINLSPQRQTIYLGGEKGKVVATFKPDGVAAVPVFSLSDTLISIGADGTIKAKAKGEVVITANPEGFPALTAVCTVLVVQDISSRRPVDIIIPSKHDTLVNHPAFTLEYLKDTTRYTKLVNLSEGPNTFVISDTSDARVTSDTVVITLDTKAPVVKISAPAESLLTNAADVPVAWTIDNVIQTYKTSENLVGKQGVILIVRQSLDSAGNLGADTLKIVRDTIPPSAPIFTIGTTASPTNKPRPTWTWSGSTEGNGHFLMSFDGAADSQTTLKTFTPSGNLGEGKHTLLVKEYDAAGNLSPAGTATIEVKTKGPGAPTVNGSAGPTRSPKWTWSGTGRSGAMFRVRLYKSGTIPSLDSLETVTLEYTPDTTLIKGSNGVTWELRVSEQDSVGNWGSEALASIVVDRVAPGIPVLSGSAQSSGSPTWTWASVENNAKYSYRLMKSGSSTPVDSGTTTALVYPPPSHSTTTLTEGSHTFYVKALDAAGNAGSEKSKSVYVDLTDPLVAITSPSIPGRVTSVNPTLTGTASDNRGLASVAYTIQGGGSGSVTVSGGNWTLVNLAVPKGTHTVTVTATDSSGRTGSGLMTITKLTNVTFVRKEAKGKGDGSSWGDAYPELWQALDSGRTYAAGAQIWVGQGTYRYKPTDNLVNTEFWTYPDLAIYGSFPAIGTSTSIVQRDSLARNSILKSRIAGKNNLVLDAFTFDGAPVSGVSDTLRWAYINGDAENVEIRNCTWKNISGATASPISISTGSLKLVDCTLTNNFETEYGAIMLLGNTAKLEVFNTSITRNCGNIFTGGVTIGGTAVFDGVVIRDNTTNCSGITETDKQVYFYFGMENRLYLKNSIIQKGVDHMLTSGEVHDEGGNTFPP